MKELNNDIINDVIITYCRKINKHLGRILPAFEPESIHRFRVEYKMLRAFIRMISIKPSIKKDVFISKKIRTIYKASGTIRNLQLQEQRISDAIKQKNKNPHAYLALLDKEIKKRKPRLANLISGKPLKKYSRKIYIDFLVSFNETSMRNYVQQQWMFIQKAVSKKHFRNKDLHAIRKKIKDLFYNMKIYEQQDAALFLLSKWKDNDPAYFDSLLNEPGTYQDYCTAISLIDSVEFGKGKNTDRKILKELKKAWISNRKKLKQLLIEKMKSGLVL